MTLDALRAPLHPDWLIPDWGAPAGVRAFVTTRAGGTSLAPCDSLNLGTRCGDAPDAVARNRALLRACLPAEPAWLGQVHGAVVVDAASIGGEVDADASYARSPGTVCGVLVADCMPVLLAARDGSAVAAAHAGWRGMSGGVIEATVRAMAVAPPELVAWLGPAIGPSRFEVGADVLDAFTSGDAGAASAFVPYPGRDGKFLCDLYALARRRLQTLGVTQVSGGGYCTVGESRFFSYRRDRVTGRMGAFVWIERQ